MAIARRAEPVDLPVPASAEAAPGTVGRHLRRWLPIGIGALLAAALVVAAAAAPFIAPLSPSAQFSDAVLKGRASSSVTCSAPTSTAATS